MRVSNKPQRLALSDYESAIEQYFARAKKAGGVHAILTMGSVGAPGLSDIDIIVVVDNDFQASKSDFLSTRGIDDRLFLHGPVVIPSSMISDLQFLIYASNLKLLWGNVDIPDFLHLPEEIKQSLYIIYLIDFTESRFQQFALLKSQKVVDIRAWLTRTWSVSHSYDLLNKAFGEDIPPSFSEIIADIKKPREDWLTGSYISDQSFMNSLNQAERLNKLIFMYVLERVWGKPLLKTDSKVWSGHKLMRFSNRESVDYEAKQIRILHKEIYGYSHCYPASYLAHLAAYSDAIKPTWLNKPIDNDRLTEIMHRRFTLVEKHAGWLASNAKFSGSMSGYTGLNSTRVKSLKGLVSQIGLRASMA